MAPMIDPNGTHAALVESEVQDLKSVSNGSDASARGVKRPADLNGNAPQKLEAHVDFAKFDGPRETRSFPCVVHMRSPAFPSVKDALPFPDDMSQLIAWTDAFVERLGWQALQQHEKAAEHEIEKGRLEKEAAAQAERAREAEKQLGPLKDENAGLRRRIAELTASNQSLEVQLDIAMGEIDSLGVTVAEKEATNMQLKRDLDGSEHRCMQLDAKCQDLLAQLEKILSNDEFKKYKAEVERWMIEDAEKDRKREALIKELEKELATTKKEVIAKETEVKQKIQELAKAQAEIAGLGVTNKDLNKRLADALGNLHKATEDLDNARSQLAAQQGLVCSLQRTKEGLEERIRAQIKQLHDAQLREDEARLAVKTAQEHSKAHWKTLQKIRADGGWLRTKASDVCDRVA